MLVLKCPTCGYVFEDCFGEHLGVTTDEKGRWFFRCPLCKYQSSLNDFDDQRNLWEEYSKNKTIEQRYRELNVYIDTFAYYARENNYTVEQVLSALSNLSSTGKITLNPRKK